MLTTRHGGDSVLPRSAVGEKQTVGPHRVEESISKLITVGDHTVVAYSGFLETSLAAVRLLREELETGVALHDALLTV